MMSHCYLHCQRKGLGGPVTPLLKVLNFTVNIFLNVKN